ncbi:MAG TPA: 1-deoxy-D-xylulose-5-phosphate synthase [Kiritimatiellia bacterium]|jgi:1-deoxy-D-xylulose-5-phosphate synthase|nr:1-deoxy-D-xylulose-5-phosphate synthase [Kiritimatiellia bacterium]HOR96797.1 1-deoxy-D-xylulose-5-phosphate synthase [Kiritimatiellia bacterium]HPW74350.1 1-deoxy-D-xylulose-5-phosphate synthase [Kiritimatiellia bacterium]HRU19291.1 1-deoxy-D-xylulose-5-phosphate synthase [Kiritimatiellia bacterium]
MSNLLKTIRTPADVQVLESGQLPVLAEEIREAILETVSRNGGHLASNLGAVELTIAILRAFSPPQDKVIWDVGHQTYAWKLLTGRRERFHTLRQRDGLSGFTRPEESDCDVCVAGHAGTALSSALGLAAGRERGNGAGHVVAVIGDGAMANGIALEALNSIEEVRSKVIVILNDNEMSISENVGALSRRLGRMLADVRYNRIKAAAEAAGHRLRMTPLRRIYYRLEQAIKSLWLQNAFFEAFGLRYVGPIDGHDFRALENALCSAREYKRSVLIHVATQKGRGFRPAERRPSAWHGVGAFDLEAGQPPEARPGGYSQAFGETLTALAERDPSVVAITAAMCSGTGLEPFASRHPERFFDVGICEAHAVVFAAGLATAGLRPVFAVYSTFLQRAVDCVMQDVCIPRLPVVFCVDRAGVVGGDGPTHHGVYDIPMLRCLPNLTIMQPKDRVELEAMLRTALALDGPSVIRYPREPGPEVACDAAVPALSVGQAEVLLHPDAGPEGGEVWIWALGDMLPLARDVATRLRDAGLRSGVVNARFVKPMDTTLLYAQAGNAAQFVTMENGAVSGGFGSALREALAAGGFDCPVSAFGWPDRFVGQGNLAELLEGCGLTAENMARQIAGKKRVATGV